MPKHELKDYTIVPRVEVSREGTALYSLEVAEIPGLIAEGATPEEAVERLRRVYDPFLETMKQHGTPIPEPQVPLARFSQARSFLVSGAPSQDPHLIDGPEMAAHS